MAKSLGAPGSCKDCGDDAYIRLSRQDGQGDMLCAHCYAERIRIASGPTVKEQVTHRVSGIRSK